MKGKLTKRYKGISKGVYLILDVDPDIIIKGRRHTFYLIEFDALTGKKVQWVPKDLVELEPG